MEEVDNPSQVIMTVYICTDKSLWIRDFNLDIKSSDIEAFVRDSRICLQNPVVPLQRVFVNKSQFNRLKDIDSHQFGPLAVRFFDSKAGADVDIYSKSLPEEFRKDLLEYCENLKECVEAKFKEKFSL